MKSKIHTNIYCPCPGVGASGVQRTPQGGGRGSGGKTVSVQGLAGPGGWLGSQRSRKSRWAGGRFWEPAARAQGAVWSPEEDVQARLGWIFVKGIRATGSGLAEPTPVPQEGRRHQGLVPPVGEVTVQVNRFKLR